MLIKDSFFDYVAIQHEDRDITAWSNIYHTIFKKMKNKNESFHGTFLYVAEDDGKLVAGVTHNPHKLLHLHLQDSGRRVITKKLWPIHNIDLIVAVGVNLAAADAKFIITDNVRYDDATFVDVDLTADECINLFDAIVNETIIQEIETEQVNIMKSDIRLLANYHNVDYGILYAMFDTSDKLGFIVED